MRLRISIRGSVRPSVGPSVGPSVRPSVTSYFKNLKIKLFLHVFHQGSLGTLQKCRIASLQECMPKKVKRAHLLVDQTCSIQCTMPLYVVHHSPFGFRIIKMSMKGISALFVRFLTMVIHKRSIHLAMSKTFIHTFITFIQTSGERYNEL